MARKSHSLRNIAVSPRRSLSPGPPSPTFSDATHASAMNFGANGPEKIITRANLKASLQAYEDLMNTSANYRAALVHMSKVTAAFADAMEACSGLKGPSYEAGTRLQAASGLHHLVGNHWHVLAETLDKKFEKPLRQHLETYRSIMNDRSASYEKTLHEKSQIIRETEKNNMNKKQRNLQTFREALVVLQRQVDELDGLKAQHYQEIMEHEEEVWDVVQGKVCVVVRSTMDIFDRFTAKASDPILEPMLQSVPDPFDSYGPPQAEDQIFTILPPLSVIANAPSPSPSPGTSEAPDSTESSPAAGPTWIPSSNGGLIFADSAPQWADVSSPASSPPQSTSPTSLLSPTTIKRRTSNHQSRKSDSKLRSVLSAIDETKANQGESDRSRSTSPDAVGRGDAHEPDINWSSFSLGYSPYPPYGEDTTPRHSSLFAASQEPDSSEQTRSPQSDQTIHLPVSSS